MTVILIRYLFTFAALPILKKPCLSPREILEAYGMESEPGVINIKPKTFLEMCPALVYQLDQRSCYKTEAPSPKLDRVWSKLTTPNKLVLGNIITV